MPKSLEGHEFDFTAANILADIIIPLAPYARKLTKKGGYITCSGILTTKEDSVVKALEKNGFEIVQEAPYMSRPLTAEDNELGKMAEKYGVDVGMKYTAFIVRKAGS